MIELFGLPLPYVLLLGGVLIVLFESIVPGAYFAPMGSTLLLGGITGVFAISFGISSIGTVVLMIAAILSTGLLSAYTYRSIDLFTDAGEVDRTRDASSLQGVTGVVIEPVTPTDGRITLHTTGFTTEFPARSIDSRIDEGDEVIVVDPGGGNVLTVEPLIDHGLNKSGVATR